MIGDSCSELDSSLYSTELFPLLQCLLGPNRVWNTGLNRVLRRLPFFLLWEHFPLSSWEEEHSPSVEDERSSQEPEPFFFWALWLLFVLFVLLLLLLLLLLSTLGILLSLLSMALIRYRWRWACCLDDVGTFAKSIFRFREVGFVWVGVPKKK